MDSPGPSIACAFARLTRTRSSYTNEFHPHHPSLCRCYVRIVRQSIILPLRRGDPSTRQTPGDAPYRRIGTQGLGLYRPMSNNPHICAALLAPSSCVRFVCRYSQMHATRVANPPPKSLRQTSLNHAHDAGHGASSESSLTARSSTTNSW